MSATSYAQSIVFWKRRSHFCKHCLQETEIQEKMEKEVWKTEGMATHSYDSIADTYDRTRFKTYRGKIFNAIRMRILNGFLGVSISGGLAFDLACGTGLISEWLLKNGCTVISGDISLGMLRVAHRKLAKSNLFVGLSELDACYLPFKDKIFDVVTSFRFFNLLPTDLRMKIHKEVARVGKGPYLFTYALDSPYQRWRGRMKNGLGLSKRSDEYPATVEGIKRELRGAQIDLIHGIPVCSLLTSELVVLASIRK